MTLTARLRAAHPIFTATHHPFLYAAGHGTLPYAVLSAWLLQDTLYTRAYIRFLGGLLSGIGALLPADLPPSTTFPTLPSSPYPRIFALLISALTNIQRETALFAATAARHRLFCPADAAAARPAPATRAYTDLFVALGANAAGGSPHALLAGLVALWATERCYFDAWSYAAECSYERGEPERGQQATQTHGPHANDDGDSTAAGPQARADEALRLTLIPNWTSPKFGAFVDECGACADALAAVVLGGFGERGGQGGQGGHDEAAAVAYRACDDVFRQVVWLEERFWPDMDVVPGGDDGGDGGGTQE